MTTGVWMCRRAGVRACGVALAAVLSAAPVVAQQADSSRQAARAADVRAQLQARGLSADLATSVATVARETDRQGLPGQVLVDKAIEGWLKHIAPGRILGAVRDLAQRLERARTDLRAAGVAQAEGNVIAGAADASAQGIGRGDQVAIIQAAPSSPAAASGLSVAAALVVQGLDPATSARLVAQSFRAGRNVAQVLDLPAAARALQVRGVAATDVGRQLLNGIGAAGTVQGAVGVTVPPVVPPIIPPRIP